MEYNEFRVALALLIAQTSPKIAEGAMRKATARLRASRDAKREGNAKPGFVGPILTVRYY